MVSDIGNFGYCILNNFTRDSYIPLPALGWPEVLIYSGKAGGITYSSDRIFQAGTNRIKTTEGRIVAQLRGSVSSPVRIYHRGPWRVTGQPQHIFDHVRTTHKAAESRAHRSLAVAFHVPSHTYSWLEPLVIWMPQ